MHLWEVARSDTSNIIWFKIKFIFIFLLACNREEPRLVLRTKVLPNPHGI
jgi:hypothetical protein